MLDSDPVNNVPDRSLTSITGQIDRLQCGLSDYQQQDGMLIPMAGEAAWIRPEGRRSYFHGTVKTLTYEWATKVPR